MEFTVYSFGDISTLRAALVAVSMMFDPANNQLFVSNSAIWGAGAVLGMSLLLGVIVMTGVGIMRAEFPPYHHLLILTSIYCVCFVPKARVQLEDKISGAVAAVDNVPLAIAMSAGLFSGAISRVSDGIETAISATDPNYIAVGSDGFLSPLRLLHSMRNVASGMPVLVPTIHNNLMRYGFSCVQDAGLSLDALKRSDDSLATFLQNGQGVVIYVSPSTPTSPGTEMTCSSAGPMILADIGNFQSVPVGGTSLSGLEAALNARVATNASMSGMGLSGPAAQTFTLYNWQNSYASVVGTSSAAAARSQQFMQQSIGSGYVMGAFGCQRTVFEDFVRCASPMIAAQEQSRGDAAAGATFYQKLAIPVANLMMFIFFAASPIVIAVAFFMGMAGMRVLVMFLMFGFWSQAWMPFANIVNFYIQRGCREDIMQLLMSYNGVIPLEALSQFYDKVGTRLQVGADMLSATPMISLALMTGSIFAISQVAGRMSAAGGDKYDEKVNAPSGISNGPAVSVGGAQTAPIGSQGWQTVAATGGGAGGLSTTDPSSFSVTSSVSSASAAAVTGAQTRALSRTSSALEGISSAVSKVVANTTNAGRTESTTTGDGVTGSGTKSVSGGTGVEIRDNRAGGESKGAGNGEEFRTGVSANASGGVGLSAGKGAGGGKPSWLPLSGDVGASATTADAQKQTRDAKSTFDSNIALANSRSTKGDTTGAIQAIKDARKALAAMFSANTADTDALNTAAQRLDSLASQLQASDSYGSSATSTVATGSNQTFNAARLAKDLATTDNADINGSAKVRSLADAGQHFTEDALGTMSKRLQEQVRGALDTAINNKARAIQSGTGLSEPNAKEAARLEVYGNSGFYAAAAVDGNPSAQAALAVSGAATQNNALGNPSAAGSILKGLSLIAESNAKTAGAEGLVGVAPSANPQATHQAVGDEMSRAPDIVAKAEAVQAGSSPQSQAQQYASGSSAAVSFGRVKQGEARGAGGIPNQMIEPERTQPKAVIRRLKVALNDATEAPPTVLSHTADVVTSAGNRVVDAAKDKNDSGNGYPESARVEAPPIKGKPPSSKN